MAAMQGRKRGKRKATATIVVDDPEHILLDRKVSYSIISLPEGSQSQLCCSQDWMNPAVPCGHHNHRCSHGSFGLA